MQPVDRKNNIKMGDNEQIKITATGLNCNNFNEFLVVN